MSTKISFGSEPNMREVPLGEHAVFKLQPFDTWSIKDTEYGEKYCLPVILFTHPSYDSIPSKGMKVDWYSKSKAAHDVFYWIYDELLKVKTFDFDIEKEIGKKWKLTRFETGAYKVEQL